MTVALVGPAPAALAAAPADAGVGRVTADLGTTTRDGHPGFSFDGAYYGYLVPADGQCDLHLYDVESRRPVTLTHARVACNGSLVHWAKHAHTLQWQVSASAGGLTAYAGDADSGQVSVLAPDAHVYSIFGISSDGRFLAFTGQSDTHPAPSVDAPGYAGYVYDRTTAVSQPLSKPDTHVQFVSWSPRDANFVANAGGHRTGDLMSGGCFGSGNSCRVFPDIYTESRVEWSGDGKAVISSPGSTGGTRLYDFTDRSLSLVSSPQGFIDFAHFFGSDSQQLLLQSAGRAEIWNRSTAKRVSVSAHGSTVYPSFAGRYLLFHGSASQTWRYLDVSTSREEAAVYRGTNGYWTGTGSAFLGIGPTLEPVGLGCTSLRQWSPRTNTVNQFAPPGSGTCYRVPDPRSTGAPSSPSGRFALFDKVTDGSDVREYIADLRRHVLLGPLRGDVQGFTGTGPDLLAVRQPLGSDTARLLLVDPTPAPVEDDQPRWSAATPLSGSRIAVGVGGRVDVTFEAADLQQTPVNLHFRWRTTAGNPVAAAPKGWACEQSRPPGGATVAKCSFEPPQDHTPALFLDLGATNFATGAQTDTRSYRIETTSAAGTARR